MLDLILKFLQYLIQLHSINSITINNTLSVYNEQIYGDNNLQSTGDILSVPIEAKYYIDATGDLNFSKN